MDLSISATDADIAVYVRQFDFFLAKVSMIGGETAIQLIKDCGGALTYFIAGRGHGRAGAIQDLHNNLEIYGMNLFKNNKLFPHIKAAMLADKPPAVMILNGRAAVVDTSIAKNDEAWKLEIGFENSPKTAILNGTQAMKIAALHGEETDDWQGKRITLWAEHGKWFGKWQYGLRVGDSVPT